jgi:hypothetical protein
MALTSGVSPARYRISDAGKRPRALMPTAARYAAAR